MQAGEPFDDVNKEGVPASKRCVSATNVEVEAGSWSRDRADVILRDVGKMWDGAHIVEGET